MKSVGVDLGGSHVLATVVDQSGAIETRSEIELADHDFELVVEAIVQAVGDVLGQSKERDLSAIGVGAPGNIDLGTGTVRYSPNFGWHEVPLGRRLAERLGRTVLVANDARCATLGEYTFGSGRGTANFALLTLGTGIGGGVVAEGNLLLGNRAGAGEFGHHQIRATDGFTCNCGKTGCFEAQASGTGLLRHALAVAHSFPRSQLLARKAQKLGSKSIRRAAEAGNPHALAAWNRFIDDLARGVANVIAFVNPELIALGGGVASAGEFMLAALRPKVEELTTMVPRGTTRIVTATLGNDAGAIGAATMARRGGLTAKEPG
ncbi:MAG: ROK family protein [Candidatus Baltobacteraceae bacterium]